MLALSAAPAVARLSVSDSARTYLQARAASMNGEHARAAQLLASLAEAQPGQVEIARKALGEAIGAGEMDLALNLSRTVPAGQLSSEARLLLVAAEIRRGHPERALPWLTPGGNSGDLSFFAPLINAWGAADRGNVDQALTTIEQIPSNSLLAALAPQQRAFLLIKAHRTAEAEPLARQSVGSAGGREPRLRLAFADAFLAGGDRARALMIIEGMGGGETVARQRLLMGKRNGQAIDNLPAAFSDALSAFSSDLVRVQRSTPPLGLLQIARWTDPRNSNATALLALLLADQDRVGEALSLLQSVPRTDSMISQVLDVQAQVLTRAHRFGEAYTIAAAAVQAPTADGNDYSRLGDVLQAMKRPGEAAAAYAAAIKFAQTQNRQSDLPTLLLLQAGALKDANRWPEAQASLQQGLTIAPDQPLLLNFLGYVQLERGENLDGAVTMIRKATDLAPDDASIIDSLGWAEFKRGKVDEAIATLQRAAEKDPDQADIQEHLGDALYRSGRRYEARYAWNAALVMGEDEIVGRVKAKLAAGLNPANAAP